MNETGGAGGWDGNSHQCCGKGVGCGCDEKINLPRARTEGREEEGRKRGEKGGKWSSKG